MFSNYSFEMRSKALEQEISQLRAQLDELPLADPKDRLVVRRQDSVFRYYRAVTGEDGKRHERYLNGENLEWAENYAKRKFCKARLKDAVAEKKIVDEILRMGSRENQLAQYLAANPGQVELIQGWIKRQSKANLRAEDGELFDKVEEWKKTPYERDVNYPENLKVDTVIPGMKVRSKSEAMILARFEERHVAYHYEEAFHGFDERGREVVLYPDFRCLNVRVGRIILLEHLGFCDDETYMRGFFWKAGVYLRGGFYLGKNLVVTSETKESPLSISRIDDFIDNWLM